IQRHQPASVYCTPLRRKDEVTGVLYAEHRDISLVFNESRLQLESTLLNQAAISLENARLIDRLVTEVGERRRAELGERQLLDILEVTPDFVAIIGLNGVLQYVNSTGRALMGLSLGEPIHPHRLASYFEGDDLNMLSEGIAAAARDEHWSGECMFNTKDGRLVPMLQAIIAHRSESTGLVDHYSVIGRDITEFKRLEGQVQHAAKMEAVGQLAAGVAHDFNNLLAIISGLTELSLTMNEEPDDQQSKWLEQTLVTCQKGADLVAQLMVFSRKRVKKKLPVDLHEVILRVVGLLSATIDPMVAVKTDLRASQTTILGDPSQLDSALLNLSLNARDAMPMGGTLTFETRNIEAENLVEITVVDTGVGMSADVQARVFEPFFTTKDVGSGTGLGLAATYGTIEQHDGRIELESAVGKGSYFRITLPTRPDGTQDIAAVSVAPLRGTGRILVVDDQEMIRRILDNMLSRLGYEVICAAGGPQGIERYTEEHADFDLVILDLNMPGLSGADTLRELCRFDPQVRVLISSGNGEFSIPTGVDAGSVVGFLQKPFSMNALSRGVAAAIP
ncbi:MAG: response regulator, partial [Rhodobacterales bacterium]|nr:response regulator [Rhodobacterales bacterium]